MRIHHLASLRAEGVYQEFLRAPAMSAGLYRHAAGASVPQEPHNEDELYHVIAGRGVINVNGEDWAVEAGTVIFVPAGVRHNFHTVSESLEVLVVFAPAETATPRR
ncbi:MAG: cupin domain-containing protein [Bryobacteraceae bacterium]